MEIIYIPDHIEGFVKKIPLNSVFIKCDWTSPEHGYSYEVECKCGCEKFKVYMNKNNRTIIKCEECAKEIVVYDLTQYPYTGVDGEIDSSEMHLYTLDNGTNVFRVCVYYEYPDANEVADDGDEFTGNFLSWCVIWIYDSNNNKIIELVNDETT